jgi:hypothetical protein
MKSLRLFAAICMVALSVAGATQMARRNSDADRRFELGALSPQTVLSSAAADHSRYLEDARAGVRGIGQYSAQPRDAVLRARARLPAPTSYILTFTASGFQPDYYTYPKAPVDPVTGTFFITLDPNVEYFSSSNIAGNVNVKTVRPFGFSYYPAYTGPMKDSGITVCSPGSCPTGAANGFTFGSLFYNFPNGVWGESVFYSTPSGSWHTRTVSAACAKPAVICEQIGVTRVCRHGFRPCP